MSDSFRPMYCSPPGSSVHEILQVRIQENSFPKNLPNPGIIKPVSPALRADSSLSESQWLDDITNSMDMSLSILDDIVKDTEVWHAAVHEVAKSRTQLNNSKKTDKGKTDKGKIIKSDLYKILKKGKTRQKAGPWLLGVLTANRHRRTYGDDQTDGFTSVCICYNSNCTIQLYNYSG